MSGENTYGLTQFPSVSYVNDGLHDAITIVVYKTKRPAFVSDCKRKLVVIDQAHLFYLGSVIHVVQKNGMGEYFGFFCRGNLYCCGSHFYCDFRVLMRQLQRVVEHLQILVQAQRRAGQLLLVQFYVVVQLRRGVDEYQFSVALQRRQVAIVELGVLAHPAVAVVDVSGVDLLVRRRRQAVEPLLQELCSESVVRTGVGEIDHELERGVAERFQG